MANELQIDTITGRTVYFLVRSATATIWNGSALEAYQTANYSSYDIAATEQGTASGYYVANMPAASAGIYYVIAKQQIGGAPDETDPTLGVGAVDWDGSAILPLSGVPGSTSLANIAASVFRRDMANDEASAAIFSLCSAVLKFTSKFDMRDASNSDQATTYRTDGTTIHMSQEPTTNASLVPTQALDKAS